MPSIATPSVYQVMGTLASVRNRSRSRLRQQSLAPAAASAVSKLDWRNLMFTDWFKFSTHIAMANWSAQRVVGLRLAMLAKGGPSAEREARRMIVEKIAASAEAWLALANGKSAQSIVRRYRAVVRANERRLSSR
jgi:hypothetical protein